MNRKIEQKKEIDFKFYIDSESSINQIDMTP